ncbi:ATP-grasp domain-containing protein [Candidatus Woesearchaeota archaeon]|nr:ATP-grasp domain-containing protein [Candidatus Woesearchaeota archaeon]
MPKKFRKRKNKRFSVGYIYFKTYYEKMDEVLIKLLEKKLNVVRIPFEEQISLDDIKEKTKRCKVIFNFATWEPVTFEGIELSKTFEELGKKVIDSSQSFFYREDKWMLYLKCLNYDLPTPKTYLIPKEAKYNSKLIKKILKEKPLVLKSVFSNAGLCVEKVSDYGMYLKKLKKLVSRNSSSPIIAQEFIPNSNRSYRITLVNHKVAQAVVKIGKSWKQVGNEKKEHFRKIELSEDLKDLCEKASKAFGLKICGLDLINNDNKWYIIEANSCPALDFIYADMPRLAKVLADYLYSECKRLG